MRLRTILAQNLETFNNTLVRRGEEIKNTKTHVTKLIKWIEAKFAKDINAKKSDKGRNAAQKRRDDYMKFFSEKNKENLKTIYDLQKALLIAKKLIIDKFDSIKRIQTFVKTKKGWKVTGEEGFVAIDRLEGGAVKLVDRMEFSMNNFDPDVIKGWG